MPASFKESATRSQSFLSKGKKNIEGHIYNDILQIRSAMVSVNRLKNYFSSRSYHALKKERREFQSPVASSNGQLLSLSKPVVAELHTRFVFILI